MDILSDPVWKHRALQWHWLLFSVICNVMLVWIPVGVSIQRDA
jgi:hypothetical protein